MLQRVPIVARASSRNGFLQKLRSLDVVLSNVERTYFATCNKLMSEIMHACQVEKGMLADTTDDTVRFDLKSAAYNLRVVKIMEVLLEKSS